MRSRRDDRTLWTQQNAAILPLRTRLMKSQIDGNYESLASHRGEPHARWRGATG
jgi:hypothetical protein